MYNCIRDKRLIEKFSLTLGLFYIRSSCEIQGQKMSEQRLLITVKDNLEIIRLNRPYKKNAIDLDMYLEITKTLNEAAVNDNISVVVLTGVGDYYSSGNDLSISLSQFTDNIIEEKKRILRMFVEAFIDFPKILVAVVNGPAIGIAATTLALCDLVFASDKSFFLTPFTKLGLIAEGCSTYTYPRIFGKSKATELLIFNHKLTAEEALNYGFVNDVFKPEEIQTKVWDRLEKYANMPKDAVLASKRLMRDYQKDDLILTNKREVDELAHRWMSEEFLNTIAMYSNKKSKI